MKFKRILISVISCVFMLVVFSVPSMALVSASVPPDDCFTLEGGNTYLQTFETSKLDANAKTFIQDWFVVSTGGETSSASYFSGFYYGGKISYITFFRTTYPINNAVGKEDSITTVSGNYQYFTFKYENGKFVPTRTSVLTGIAGSGGGVSLDILLTYGGGCTESSFASGMKYLQPTGTLVFVDDDGLFNGGIFPPVSESHSLTIDYKYEDGTTAAESHVESLAKDAPYSVVSPSVAGFVPSLDLVSGTMPDENLTVTVTYMPSAPPLSEHTLTIHYVHEGGGQAADSVVRTYPYTSPYSIASPSLPGYTADVRTVTGRMPDEDVTITVTYSPTSSSGGGSGGGGDWIFSNPFAKPGVFPSFDFSNPFTKPGSQSFQFSNPFLNPYK